MSDTTFPPLSDNGYPKDQGAVDYGNSNNGGGWSRDNSRQDSFGGQSSQNNGQGGGYGGGGGNRYNGGGSYGGSSGGGNRYNGGGYGGGNGQGGGGYQKKPWQKNGGGGGFKRPENTDMSFYRTYAVTGNQNAPHNIIDDLSACISFLNEKEYTLRTGGLEGIETVAEKAAKKLELHLPFRGFAEKDSKFTFNSDHTKAIAKIFHPGIDDYKPGQQVFIYKDIRIMMGNNTRSPSLFLLVWTEDGAESAAEVTPRTGFAATAIRVACALGVPVFNLGKSDTVDRLKTYINSCDILPMNR